MNSVILIGVIAIVILVILMAISIHSINSYDTSKPIDTCDGTYARCAYENTQEILNRLDRLEVRLNQTD